MPAPILAEIGCPPARRQKHEPLAPPPSQETLQALEAQYRSVVCQRLVECGQAAGQESCERYIQFETGSRFTGTAQIYFRQGRRIVFDARNAQQCFAAIPNKPCAALDVFAQSSLELKECRETFKGTVKAGERCQESECEPGTFCSSYGSAQNCFGTCTRPVRAGGSLGPYDRCEEGLVDFDHSCYTPRHEGERCFSRHNQRYGCPQGLYCNSSAVCEPRRAEGVACESTGACVSALECARGQCRQPQRLLRVGESWCGGAQVGSARRWDFACPTCPVLGIRIDASNGLGKESPVAQSVAPLGSAATQTRHAENMPWRVNPVGRTWPSLIVTFGYFCFATAMHCAKPENRPERHVPIPRSVFPGAANAPANGRLPSAVHRGSALHHRIYVDDGLFNLANTRFEQGQLRWQISRRAALI